MTSHVFFKNTLWNLLGSIFPLAIGLLAIPRLISALGVERFGLLNLGWLLVGYFSLFDLGLGRALTRLVAERLSIGESDEIPRIVGTAMQLMSWLGVGSCFLVVVISPELTSMWLKIPVALEHETLIACFILGITLPFVVLGAGWRGVLEAYGRFDLVNWIRVPLGVAIFVTPLLVLPFFDGLIPVVGALAVTRVLGWWFCRYQCFLIIPSLAEKSQFDPNLLRPLLSFGGWMTVSNIVGPLMVYADRFLIGGMISAAAVAYYSTPYEIVTRLWVIPGAMTGVLFPIIAGRFLVDRLRAVTAYERAMKAVFFALLPVVAFLFLFAEEGLRWWLGSDFATNGFFVARVLVIGVFINALGQVAITVLHGAGRADWAAKLHLFELPFYFLLLFIGATRYGIEGVAVAWLLRVVVDAISMVILVQHAWDASHRFAWLVICWSGAAMVLLGLSALIDDVALRLVFLCLLLLACGTLLPRQLRVLSQVTSDLANPHKD